MASLAQSCTSKPPSVLFEPCFSIFLAFQPPSAFDNSLPWPRLCVPWEGLFFISNHFLLCLGPNTRFSSTTVIRPPFRALFDPNVIQSQNYLSWSASVELWFMGQGYEDHLVTPEDAIPDVDKVQWKKIDAQLCNAKGLYTNDIQRFYKVVSDIVHVRQQDMDLSTYIGRIASLKEEFLTLMPFTNGAEAQQIQTDKFFMVLTLIGLRPDLESVRDQFLLPLRLTLEEDVVAIGRGQRPQCTYCNKLGHTRDRCYQLHGRPPRTAHIAQSSDPLLSRPDSLRAPHLRVSPLLVVIMMPISISAATSALLLLLPRP
ncbi:hypothetical protein CK203_079257 [Vitis vinifera]|uniref:Retrotransposon Copia-like N-terminal domain-containing protein n=1 Tax=Vitis vinifera TaxID=29760 RepID=A0A438FBC8_VITVI|nr:hypothetical protein CK203_079257 [Vitis vinifera]